MSTKWQETGSLARVGPSLRQEQRVEGTAIDHMPRISVVISAYNAAKYLAQTLDSVLAQTFHGWELVIVDDGSSDETGVVARQYAARDARIRVVRQENSGVAMARNRGLDETAPAADYVMFLDADDMWEADTLERLVGALAAHPEAVGAHGLTMNEVGGPPGRQDARDRRAIVGARPVPWPVHAPTTFAGLVLGCFIVTPGTVLIRRAALRQVGGFDPSARAAEDWAMWLRLSALGDIAFVNSVVLRYRLHSTSLSRDRRRMHRAELDVYRKLVSSAGLTAEQRRLVRLGYRWLHWERSRNNWAWAKRNAARGRWIAAAKQARHALIDTIRFGIGIRTG